jgi:tripartite ATP-independent transporter DctM subunit
VTAIVATLVWLLLLLLGAGVWIGLALIGLGLVSLELFRDTAAGAFLAGDLWRSFNASELAALPLFILMGELLASTRLAQQLFTGLGPLVQRVPGGLVHTNILGCTLFAAVSGSSAATTATVGRITVPELLARGYDRSLVLGSLCGAGTLGFLIPPSIIMIVYGVLSDTSIVDLFIAGITPGLLVAALFMVWVGLRGRGGVASDVGGSKRAALLAIAPVTGLIAVVVGALYSGFAGPSEAAVIGVAGALILGLAQRGLTLARLWAALMATVITCGMLALVMAGAFFLSKVVGVFGIPTALADFIASLGLSPIALIGLLIVVYVVLGCLLDGLSMIVMTLPIALPLVVQAGFSPVWFGIFLVIVVEMSQITPPVGFNLFVVRELTGDSLASIARAAFPFFLILAGFALTIAAVPELVTWPL